MNALKGHRRARVLYASMDGEDLIFSLPESVMKDAIKLSSVCRFVTAAVSVNLPFRVLGASFAG